MCMCVCVWLIFSLFAQLDNDAMIKLAYQHWTGVEGQVPRNRSEAERLFNRAAEDGYFEGLFNMVCPFQPHSHALALTLTLTLALALTGLFMGERDRVLLCRHCGCGPQSKGKGVLLKVRVARALQARAVEGGGARVSPSIPRCVARGWPRGSAPAPCAPRRHPDLVLCKCIQSHTHTRFIHIHMHIHICFQSERITLRLDEVSTVAIAWKIAWRCCGPCALTPSLTLAAAVWRATASSPPHTVGADAGRARFACTAASPCCGWGSAAHAAPAPVPAARAAGTCGEAKGEVERTGACGITADGRDGDSLCRAKDGKGFTGTRTCVAPHAASCGGAEAR
jgi:hypothetical protein